MQEQSHIFMNVYGKHIIMFQSGVFSFQSYSPSVWKGIQY